MVQRTLELEYDKLVIGADLSALSYAYINKIPLIYTRRLRPFKYDDDNQWKSLRDTWNKLSFLLAYTKYMPFGNTITNIKIDNSFLKCITKNYLTVNITYNNLFIFDDYKIDGLTIPTGKTNNFYHVLDYFNVLSGASHDYKYLTDNDDFVKKVIFYPTKRVPFNFRKNIKDCVSISRIEEQNLLLDEYSQNYSRLKTTNLMFEAGIKGYYDKKDNYYRKVRLETDKRKIYSLGKNKYSDLPNNIKFIYDDYKKLLNEQPIVDEYMEYIKGIYGFTA